MATSPHFWIHSQAAHAALFDEIEKIADATSSGKSWKKDVARTMIAGGLGVAGGRVAADVLAEMAPEVFKLRGSAESLPARMSAAKVILPILGATSLMMLDRYRRRMDTQYRKAPGWSERSDGR